MLNNMKNNFTSPPITWFGSKSRLVKKITAYFPKHTAFVDVFGGSGAVLLGKKPSKVEVYNDINKKLVALFHVLADKVKTRELIKRLEYTPYSRAEFEFCRDNIDLITDEIELAKMMLVIQRQSHGGNGKNWSYSIDDYAAGCSSGVRKFHAGIERLKDVHYRIRRVQVENLSWQELLNKYDRLNTLFYLDPPYIRETRIDGGYEHELTNADHEKLVKTLLNITGKAVLSGYSHPLYTPLEAAGWQKIEIESLAYSSDSRNKRVECLWLSPNCKEPEVENSKIDLLSVLDYTENQLQIYGVHKQRVDDSTRLIQDAIKSLKKRGERITKAEVARMTGISRVHISRRYSDLFDE